MAVKQLEQPWLWKRFYNDSIEQYTGADGELIMDLRDSVPQVRLCDGVIAGGHLVQGSSVFSGAARPVILSPVPNVDVLPQPIIQASPFVGIDTTGNSKIHLSTCWQISTTTDFSNIVYDSGFVSEHLTTLDLEAVGVTLPLGTCHVRVMYLANNDVIVGVSDPVTFTVKSIIPETQLAKLLASDGAERDQFGAAVALSSDGTIAVIGAVSDNDKGVGSGSVYIFTRNANGTWSQQQKLIASDGAAADSFGHSVVISSSGDIIVIGADGKSLNRGAVYVFTRSGATWVQTSKLLASDGFQDDHFGAAIGLSTNGSYLFVGAYYTINGTQYRKGAVYVFTRSGATWVQTSKLFTSDGVERDYFGSELAANNSGNTVLVGARFDDVIGDDSGSAYIFTRNANGTWSQQQKLIASDGAARDSFGYSVTLSTDGNTAFIGSPNHDISRGAVYVFTRSGATWVQTSKLLASDGVAGDRLGSAVAISNDGRVLVIGARTVNGLYFNSGAVYVFTRETDGSWVQQSKMIASDAVQNSDLGDSVAVNGDGNTILAGAVGQNDFGIISGAAYLFG